MKYNELSELWQKQRKNYQSWELGLTIGAQRLRDKMEQVLKPPEKKWTHFETHVEYRYIELVDFYGKKKAERKPPKSDSINLRGELIFGLSVTFDHGVDSYPKANLYMPIAMRVSQTKFEYALFDIEKDTVDEEWTTDAEAFCLRMIQQYADYLDHDPHAGFGKKSKIGFV